MISFNRYHFLFDLLKIWQQKVRTNSKFLGLTNTNQEKYNNGENQKANEKARIELFKNSRRNKISHTHCFLKIFRGPGRTVQAKICRSLFVLLQRVRYKRNFKPFNQVGPLSKRSKNSNSYG
ncbi:hypothetical protein L1887_36189 [Cichorium endivia]|nr:hypothetical protein L1887_36189 [Cichorium endivia]